MRKKQILNVFILVVVLMNVGASANSENCVDELNAILFSTSHATKSRKIKAWEAKKNICGKDKALFSYGKSKIYMKFGDTANAEKILRSSLSYKSFFHKYIQKSLVDVEFYNIVYSHQPSSKELKSRLSSLSVKYEALVAKYPDWYGGYSGLGELRYALNELKNAEFLLRKATEKDYADATVYRHLTFIYNKLKKYKLSISAFDNALKLDKNLLNDKEFMIVAAYSYMYYGDLDFSRKILALLLQEIPGIKRDDSFLTAGKALAKLYNGK